jgi:hypothetical protein
VALQDRFVDLGRENGAGLSEQLDDFSITVLAGRRSGERGGESFRL